MKARLAALLTCLLAVPASQAWETEYFGGFSFGNVTLEKSGGEIERNLARNDWPAAQVDIGDGGTITKVYAGAFFSRGMGVRATYVDLGKVDVRVAGGVPAGAEQEFANDVLDSLPNTGTGISLAVQGRFPVSDRLTIHDWAGLFFWNTDQSITVPGNSATLTTKRSQSGTDLMLGGALEYLMTDQIGVRLEAERYNQSNDGITMFGLGVAYYF